MCLISPSHPTVGGSEQTTNDLWAYISPPSSSFTVGHFIFLFFRSVLLLSSPLFCFFDPRPSPISPVKHAGIGHAMVNKLHYLVDITLIVLPFGLPWVFLTVRFSLFCFLPLFDFGCFALPFSASWTIFSIFASPLVFLFPFCFFFGPNSNPKDKWKSRNLACPCPNPLTPEFRFPARGAWGRPVLIGSG